MPKRVAMILVSTAFLAVVGCSDDSSPTGPGTSSTPTETPDFSGPFAMDRWSLTGIEDGETSISPD